MCSEPTHWNGCPIQPQIRKRVSHNGSYITCCSNSSDVYQQSRRSRRTGRAVGTGCIACGCFLRRVAWQQGFSPQSERETFWILSIWMPSQQISHTQSSTVLSRSCLQHTHSDRTAIHLCDRKQHNTELPLGSNTARLEEKSTDNVTSNCTCFDL